jgi:uncharacterized protein YcfJ
MRVVSRMFTVHEQETHILPLPLGEAAPQQDRFSWRVPVIGAIAGGVLGLLVVRYTADPLHIPAGGALGGVLGSMIEASRRQQGRGTVPTGGEHDRGGSREMQRIR